MATTYAHIMRPVSGLTDPGGASASASFGRVAADLRTQCEQLSTLRPELTFEDVPAPKTLAPYASAIAAAVRVDDAEIGSGRLVLLYDPAGQRGWAAGSYSSTSLPLPISVSSTRTVAAIALA